MLMLQVAHQCGYISVNWTKVNRDMKNTKLHLPKNVYKRSAQSYTNQLFNLVKHNAPITLGFAGGILLGIAS
uniref:FUN14 domain-containing protein 1B-like n=1 Tax=Phallusia mammillata TaxID=59560 RepID=A0A6F9DDV0_9ASCI|nr:FUN14 domain-containing protein 1B-like [Phallusia mammillata]